MTVSLKDMINRQPPEVQKNIRSRSAELIAEELARSEKATSSTTYQIFVDASGGWRWRLIAANGRILASSGEAYKSKKSCLASVSRVRSAAGAGTVIIAVA